MAIKKLIQFNLNPDEIVMVDELASANTGNNRSMLIRKLVTAAWENPELFGLHPPKGRQPPSKGSE